MTTKTNNETFAYILSDRNINIAEVNDIITIWKCDCLKATPIDDEHVPSE